MDLYPRALLGIQESAPLVLDAKLAKNKLCTSAK
jgi:hypothetical protein